MSTGPAGAIRAAVNWTKVLAKCTPNVRKTILDTRSRHEDLRRQILEAQSTQPKLDFAAYRKQLPAAMAGLVNEMETKVKNFKPAKVNLEAQLNELDQEQQIKMKLSQEFLVNLEQNIENLKTDLKKLEGAKTADEVTVEDVYSDYPEIREQVYQKIRDDNWGTTNEDPNAKDAHHH